MNGFRVRKKRLPVLQISRDELTSPEEKSIAGYVGVESDKKKRKVAKCRVACTVRLHYYIHK